jgi:cation:H+ antiporter
MVWLQFALCIVFIGLAGVRLTRYGDAIADKTGLGGTWVGVVLIASVTSLPELVTGISSVTVANTPDIAAGDVLGSCVFNLLVIVMLDFLYRTESVYTRASQGHILAGGFGVMMIGFTGFNILLASDGNVLSIGHVGIYSPVIVLLYAIAMRTVFRYERAQMKEVVEAEDDQYPHYTLRQVVARYVAAAAVVVAAGAWLPFVAKDIAVTMAWEESFVGTLLVAFVTSLPEIVVTVAAVRLGSVDIAVGNLFGSNLFNILILAVDDVLFLPGDLFSAVDSIHAVSALSAMMMTGVAIVGLLYRPRTRVLRTVGWTSIFLFCVYLINSYVLFLFNNKPAL